MTVDVFSRRELLTSTMIDGRHHARYRTATRTLCGLEAPRHIVNADLPDCGVCSKVARAFDRIDGTMPDHWRHTQAAA